MSNKRKRNRVNGSLPRNRLKIHRTNCKTLLPKSINKNSRIKFRKVFKMTRNSGKSWYRNCWGSRNWEASLLLLGKLMRRLIKSWRKSRKAQRWLSKSLVLWKNQITQLPIELLMSIQSLVSLKVRNSMKKPKLLTPDSIFWSKWSRVGIFLILSMMISLLFIRDSIDNKINISRNLKNLKTNQSSMIYS